jgi:DNA ligase (NAD+)
MDEILKRISSLRKKISKYNDLYYKKGISEISDFEYDNLLKELEKLENQTGGDNLFVTEETEASPTRSVGSDLTEGFKKIRHKNKMLSIANSYNYDDLTDFDSRIKKILEKADDVEYCVELKIDGLAVSAVYKNGKLDYAATRGDGVTGDDITSNFKTVSGVPFDFRDRGDFEVRGEIYIDRKDFDAINEERENSGLDPFANPRNTAAGSIKLLDTEEVRKRKLKLISYYLEGENSAMTQSENLELLQKMGFWTSGYYKVCRGISMVAGECAYWEKRKHDMPFDIDGLVIKVNSFEIQARLGETSKAPRWVIAYKFAPDRAQTALKDIILQVGRTGAVTPVAVLEPVELSGTIVKRATLHNFDELSQKDFRIGDTVLIEKAGEIIPQVVSYLAEKRHPDSVPYKMTEKCPACGEKLVRPIEEVVFRCVNSSCPAQIERQIGHFASKGAMDISGLGPQMVRALLSAGAIKDISDIYGITKEKLLSIDRMGELSSSNLLNSISESRKRSMENLLFGLGIRHVGKEASLSLSRYFKSLESVMTAERDDLLKINDIGDVMADSIFTFFRNEKNKELISRLKEVGLNTGYIESHGKINEFFPGKTFVITGSFERMSRENIRDIITGNNGRVSSAVGRGTDYLLCGSEPGSKYDKAVKAGIKIIDEQEFYKLIE